MSVEEQRREEPRQRKVHWKQWGPYLRPTVSLDVISLVARSCGYDRGQIEHRAAQSFAVHVATQRGLAKRLPHRYPPCAQPVAPMRQHHCGRPRLPPRSCTAQAPSRDQGQLGGAHGRRNDPIASQCHGRRCLPVSPLFASWPWPRHHWMLVGGAAGKAAHLVGCASPRRPWPDADGEHIRGAGREQTVRGSDGEATAAPWINRPIAVGATGVASTHVGLHMSA